MNREIRYRQPIRNRDGSFKEWFYWGFINGQWIENAIHLNGLDTRTESQQFTGLTDKNGKDIYEGDILNVCDWGGEHTSLGIASVEWDSDEIGWRYSKGLVEDAYDMYKSLNFSKIIGNIFSNPELLNP